MTFTVLAKIYSIEYFCNTKVPELGENFWLYGITKLPISTYLHPALVLDVVSNWTCAVVVYPAESQTEMVHLGKCNVIVKWPTLFSATS